MGGTEDMERWSETPGAEWEQSRADQVSGAAVNRCGREQVGKPG